MFSNKKKYIDALYNWVIANIKYDYISLGVHENANRIHTHIGLVNIDHPNVKHLRLYYNKKGLKEIHPDIKLSVHECSYADAPENRDKPRNGFCDNDQKALGYPLKEYSKYEDIKYREYINIDDKELEGLRLFAHSIYRASKYQQNNKEEKQEASNYRMLSLEDYVTKKIETELMELDTMYAKSDDVKKLKQEYEDNVGKLYVFIFRIVCDYNMREQKLSWRWSDIANYSYSKMYRICDDDEYHSKIIMFQQKLKYNVK